MLWTTLANICFSLHSHRCQAISDVAAGYQARLSPRSRLIQPHSVREKPIEHHINKLSTSPLLQTPSQQANPNHLHHRPVSTQKLTPEDSQQILVEQRKHRPVSPHLSIYRPQITWYLSSLNRITGAVLSGGFYVFGAAYLVSPLFGWHLESASLAAAFASWPVLAKVATKFVVALPFTFHSLNGVRHLVWDTASQFKNQQVIRTGWTVVALSSLSALYLATLV